MRVWFCKLSKDKVSHVQAQGLYCSIISSIVELPFEEI
uniref:Uncharacterized protein n=1 Tax=Rhizophora mucronata TaxID=61149 RepID=A0A2P2NM79_RHIMU